MKNSLQRHVKSIHDGVKHSCEFCEYKANRKSNLQQQFKSIHERVKYSCESCDYKATWRSSFQYQYHVKSIHEGVKQNKQVYTVFTW